MSNQDNNNNFNNKITQRNNNNNKDIYIKNIADIKSDIEKIIKSNIIRKKKKKISSKNINLSFSYDNRKRNYDLKGKTNSIFYFKYNSLKNNQFEDKIIQKKNKKDLLFNDFQNINKSKFNTSTKKNNNY